MALAIITGASGGIGLCMAEELAARKYDLLLIARSTDKLKTISASIKQKYNVQASFLSLDLSVPTSVAEITKWLDTQALSPEILINNAGYGIWGPVENISPSDLDNMMQLNMNTLVQACRQLLPYLKKNKTAYIMNVASTAAYQAVPTLSTYAATKAFVVLFSRGLRWELSKSGVSVTCLSPGATTTGFIDRAGMDESIRKKSEKFSMTPEAVSKIAIAGMFAKKAEVIPGFMNWISAKATGFLPKVMIEKIAAGIYE